jgi:hypothetical protein
MSDRAYLAFLIESADGRVRICTASPDMAVEHVEALRAQGVETTISDINGRTYTLKSLHKHADLRARQLGYSPRDRTELGSL